MEITKLSERLRGVLQDLEKITGILEKVEGQTAGAANDDSLPCDTPSRKDV